MKGHKNLIFLNKKYRKLPKADGKHYYIYFIQVGSPFKRVFKIGTTNDLLRRMKEHSRNYGTDDQKEDIAIIWFKKVKSKWTTLRIEEETKTKWIENEPTWEYIRNDRFVLPNLINQVSIKIRKNYSVNLDCECMEIDHKGNFTK